MISIWLEEAAGLWFGVACHEDRLVATATGTGREEAARALRASLPRNARHEPMDTASGLVRDLVPRLVRLETGRGEAPPFELCPDCVSEPVAAVAQIASAIPHGFVATYGGVATAAGTEARVVGHIMATNPLYPIIPCHRVVGADLALVGYTGKQDATALLAKLGRLRSEAQGFTAPRVVVPPLRSRELPVFPVERVIDKAVRDGLLDDGRQLSLW